MRVVCENCGATYKIPESKLVKEVNKATCRKCGFRMMIRRPASTVAATEAAAPKPDEAATQVTANPLHAQAGEVDMNEAHTRIKKVDPADLPPENEWSDEGPTQVRADPLAESTSKKPAGKKKPTPKDSEGKAPADMVLALCATFAAAAGPMLLATNAAGGDAQRMAGLFLGLFGSLTCLFLLVTGNLWRQRGNVPISIALATVLSMGGTAFVEVAIHDNDDAPVAAADIKEAPKAKPADVTADDAKADGLGQESEKAEDAAEAADGVADAADAPPPPKPSAPETSAERTPPPPPEPVEDEETLDDPDLADIPPTATRSDAEERRRREMEAAAARAKTEREAREAERKRARESRRNRRSKAAPTPTPAPAPAAAAPAKMKSLPLTVVDTMIKTNLTVKRCFFAEKKATGSLPSRVNVYFTVMPTGKVASARVTTAEYKGTTLDSCLGRAFKGINFPPFEGDPLTMTYPFIL